ncbi:galactokinase [Alphaproteobacteria bacterium]|nr:galactokinase [Alphaproteobacteria bacterium]
MILVRAPLRITLGGGGTDLPSYFQNFGGLTVSAAIDKSIYLSLVRPFDNKIRLKYSSQEVCDTIDEIDHTIMREVLRSAGHSFKNGIEISSQADVPSGTGLGSSGAFTVALCHAVCEYKRQFISQIEAAEWACDIEINVLGRPVGKQDQYISAVGGIQTLRYQQDESVDIQRLNLMDDTLGMLDDNLMMFFTGYSREAASVLNHQDKMTKQSDDAMLEKMHDVKRNGEDTIKMLETGDLMSFAESLNEHWRKKRERSPGMSNANIDEMYALGMANGALGGKLVGAGSGGFMLFYAHDKVALRRSFSEKGYREMPFRFCFGGVETLTR